MSESAKKILIVDDDTAFSESNRDLLEACGYEVHTAMNGADGVAMAMNVRPDLMILDVMMTTDTEGFEVARRVHGITELRNMAVLLVTGAVKSLNLSRAIEPDAEWLPVDRVLEKPVDPNALMAEIERLISNRCSKNKGGSGT